jgi:hypothetical protein
MTKRIFEEKLEPVQRRTNYLELELLADCGLKAAIRN